MTAVSGVENPNFEYGQSGDAIAALQAATMPARDVAARRHDSSHTRRTAPAAATALPSATAALGKVSGFPIRR